MGALRRFALAVTLAACSAPREAAPRLESVASSAPAPSADPSIYFGRKLAEPMSYLGADWLERSSREEEEQPEHVLDVIGISAGQTIADVGAGSGYFTERLSRRVGANGHVLATDLQPEMLAFIRQKVVAKSLNNVETILATESSTNLPRNAVDLVLMVDVYHELPKPGATLAQIREALKPEGRLVLVEYRGEDPNVPIKEEHKMTLAQIRSELEAASFSIARVDESLPWQRIVIARPR